MLSALNCLYMSQVSYMSCDFSAYMYYTVYTTYMLIVYLFHVLPVQLLLR
jgi:hypothetical protein